MAHNKLQRNIIVSYYRNEAYKDMFRARLSHYDCIITDASAVAYMIARFKNDADLSAYILKYGEEVIFTDADIALYMEEKLHK